MFQESRFKLTLWKIRRDQSKKIEENHKLFSKKWKELPYPQEEFSKLVDGDMEIYRQSEDKIASAYTTHLLAQADQLLIPHPPFVGDVWIQSKTEVAGIHLSPGAAADLRDAIRKERRDRSEITRLWLGTVGPIVAALTGFVGALIGLLAALHH